MEKEKLIEQSKQYFDGKKIDIIYATEDGHFFYEAEDASYHLAKNNVKLISIKREDLKPKEPKKVVEKAPKKDK